ncbi:unnamed protein product [Arctogadus glacialis]
MFGQYVGYVVCEEVRGKLFVAALSATLWAFLGMPILAVHVRKSDAPRCDPLLIRDQRRAGADGSSFISPCRVFLTPGLLGPSSSGKPGTQTFDPIQLYPSPPPPSLLIKHIRCC